MKPTNMLFIMSDEHNPHVTGCYGNDIVQTPNIDALAAEGTRFTTAYCNTPICVPSRASFATGRYAHAIESWDNAAPYTGEQAESWGHRLGAQGHKVTTVGKLHYRQVGDPTGFPDQRLPMHILEGVGDLYGMLRDEMPVKSVARQHVLDAGPADSEYVRYDRGIGQASAKWLREEAVREQQPWALFVSFVLPHFPFKVPAKYYDLYPLDKVPLPIQFRHEDWPRHPALEKHRALSALDTPFDEATIRRAVATYYGMVTYLDEQIGVVLNALDEAGLRDTTRIVYTSDHGEMLGEHGLWFKSSMYEASVSVPFIISGPGIPRGKVSTTPIHLVDCFPTIVESVGARFEPADSDLPGTSLLRIANEIDRDRTVFSEYHTVYSERGVYMLRDQQYKYVYFTGLRPQLFNLATDPDELHDLAEDPAYIGVLSSYERQLRSIIDPESIDERARSDQRRRIAAAGGKSAVIAAGVKIPYSPAPDEFGPAPVEARERAKTGTRTT